MESARRSQPVGMEDAPTESLLGPAFAATLDRRRRRYALPASTGAELAPVDAFYDRLATPPPAPPAPEPVAVLQVVPCATMPARPPVSEPLTELPVSRLAAAPPEPPPAPDPFVEPPTAEPSRPVRRPTAFHIACGAAFVLAVLWTRRRRRT